jgi:predicted ATPase
MKLSKIKIKNYRGILDEQELHFGDFSTLVGGNDAGKSIVLHAINLFLNDEKIDKKDFHNCSESQEVIISTFWTFSDLRTKIIEHLKKGKAKDVGHVTYTDAVLGEKNILGIRKKYEKENKKATQIEVRIFDYKQDDYRNLWDKSDSDLDSIINDLSVEIPKAGEGRNSKAEKVKYIKESLDQSDEEKAWVWVDDTFDLVKILPTVEFFQCESSIETGTPFRTYLRNEVKNIFENKDENLKGIEQKIKERMEKEGEEIGKYMKEHVSTLEAVSINPVFNWTKGIDDIDVEFKFSDDKDPVPMENKGSGYRRLFMVGRFQYLANKKESENTIYMIEEPETFLHPSAQKNFLKSLISLSENNQILITSHSPIFAGASGQEYVTLAQKTRKDSGETHSTYLQKPDYSNGNDFLLSIIRELGIKPSYNLRDKFEKIVFMESHNDIDFLKTAAHKLGYSYNDEECLFLPGGGNALSNFVDIEYFSKQGRPLFLIIDSDKNQEDDNKHRQNKKLLENFEDKDNAKGWMLQRSEIENYYHPDAIKRLGKYEQDINEGELFTKEDNVPKILKQYREENEITDNLKFKGNTEIFNEMSEEEWQAVSDGELEDVFQAIFSTNN